ncbi:hypothetical protein MAIT1_03915 [Magnetofaba australis IT-1]|uniref:Uncharacterized protein n=1 Tax=Magnetofaba australis IT-1 TaxID=1434232 RepID=A0A1Y2KBH4_9PROT|nr:hypothetical protein MAIT1_03915 [Magnetofaba australis IT-1]
MGESRQEAIEQALSNAVQQVLGARIDARSVVANGALDYARLSANSAGLIRSHVVTAEGRDDLTGGQRVTIKADVDESKSDSITDCLLDPKCQSAFQQNHFDQRRVMVVAQPRAAGDLTADHPAAQALLDAVEERLAAAGFRVFLADRAAQLKRRLGELSQSEQNAGLTLARQESADALALATLRLEPRALDADYAQLYASVALKLYDVTTGELFANVAQRGKRPTASGPEAQNATAAMLASALGKQAAEQGAARIVARFTGNRESFVTIALLDLPLKQQDRIEDLLADELRWRYRIQRQSGKLLELEILTELPPAEARRRFRAACRNQGVKLESVEMKGARIVMRGG